MNQMEWIRAQADEFFGEQTEILTHFGLEYRGVQLSNAYIWHDLIDTATLRFSFQGHDLNLVISYVDSSKKLAETLTLTGPSEISLGDSSILFSEHMEGDFAEKIRRSLAGTFALDNSDSEDRKMISPGELESEGLLDSPKAYENSSDYWAHYRDLAHEWKDQEDSAREELTWASECFAKALSFIGTGEMLENLPPSENI